MTSPTSSGSGDGTIIVRPILNSAPVFYAPDYWTESAHEWGDVVRDVTANEKPSAVVETSLDMTLGAVLDAACSAWGFAAGPQQTQYTGQSAYAHVGFVLPRHQTEPITREESYRWKGDFPVILEDGTEERLGVHAVTYRQLLAAAALGLIEGDVTRPIIQPSIPQGSGYPLPELVQMGADAARIAYAEIDTFVGQASHVLRVLAAAAPTAHRDADQLIDDGTRIGTAYVFVNKLREHFKKK